MRAVEAAEELPSGLIFVPYGPWISCIIKPETDGTGMPSFKGAEVDVEAAKAGEILKLEKLLGR